MGQATPTAASGESPWAAASSGEPPGSAFPRGPDASAAPNSGRGRLARWLLAFYWPLLFTSTHVPHLSVPLQNRFNWMSFAAHATSYCVLTILLLRACATGTTSAAPRWKTIGKLLLLVAAYGALDEISQPLFQRDADPRDWLCDVSGSFIGLALVKAIDRFRRR